MQEFFSTPVSKILEEVVSISHCALGQDRKDEDSADHL
jgi:hypothetical protein